MKKPWRSFRANQDRHGIMGLERKTAPAGNRGLTHSLDRTEEGLMAHSMPPRTDAEGQPDDVLFGASPTLTAPRERHWFVPDADGSYCCACNLPRANGRHVERAV